MSICCLDCANFALQGQRCKFHHQGEKEVLKDNVSVGESAYAILRSEFSSAYLGNKIYFTFY